MHNSTYMDMNGCRNRWRRPGFNRNWTYVQTASSTHPPYLFLIIITAISTSNYRIYYWHYCSLGPALFLFTLGNRGVIIRCVILLGYYRVIWKLNHAKLDWGKVPSTNPIRVDVKSQKGIWNCVNPGPSDRSPSVEFPAVRSMGCDLTKERTVVW